MHGHKSQWKRNEIIKAICLPTSTANPAQNSHKLNMVGCGIWLLNCKSPFILRRQLHESGFFQNCGTFYFDLYWKYHNFERNEICATVFLKSTDFIKYPTFEGFFIDKTCTKLDIPHIAIALALIVAEHKSEKMSNFGFEMY